MSNDENLQSHIVSLSEASNFNVARLEWILDGFTLNDDWDECPCGKDIKELCHIKNVKNGNQTYVGNVCVNRFIQLDTGGLFAGLKRINKNPLAAPNEDLIIHAYKSGYIFDNEYGFLMATKRKRKLSSKQLAWRVKINRRILAQTVVSNK